MESNTLDLKNSPLNTLNSAPQKSPSPLLPRATSTDYNYPSLNRKDLMYLSSITNEDAPFKRFKQLDTNRNWSINLFNLDIEGSSPRKIGAFNQKVDYTNKNDDIEKSSSRILHKGLNKPQYNLSTEGIEYAKPNCVQFQGNRHTNPLMPQYKLPSCPPAEPYVPRFIRNNFYIKDIEGTSSKKIVSEKILRESLKKDDIKDSWPRKPYVRGSKYEYMNYRDVTDTQFKTKRNTNPLNPIYTLGIKNDNYNNRNNIITNNSIDNNSKSNNDIKTYSYGPISGNKPCVFNQIRYKVPYNLRLDDIEGSTAGSKNKIKKFNSTNSCYNITDIEGSNSGSLLKGIHTLRQTNPVDPKYQYPGEKELSEMNSYNCLTNCNTIDQNLYRNKNSINTYNQTYSKSLSDDNFGIQNSKLNSINSNNNNVIKIIENDNSNNTKNFNKNKKIVEKNYVITEGYKDDYKAFIRPDGKPDFGILPFVNDKIEYDKNKYHKQDPNYEFLHDPYVIPDIPSFRKNKNNSQIKTNKSDFNIVPTNIPNQVQAKEEIGTLQQLHNLKKNFKINNNKSKNFGKYYEKQLDDILAKSNLKYIEPPPKVKEPPPQPEVTNEEGEGDPNANASNPPEKVAKNAKK